MADNKLLGFKRTMRGEDKKGRDKLTIYMTQEEAAAVIEEIQANIGNERGVKLTLHTEEKEAPWGGVALSTFGFVSAVQAPGQGGSFGGGGKGKFVPKKSQGMSPAARKAAAATLNTEVE